MFHHTRNDDKPPEAAVRVPGKHLGRLMTGSRSFRGSVTARTPSDVSPRATADPQPPETAPPEPPAAGSSSEADLYTRALSTYCTLYEHTPSTPGH